MEIDKAIELLELRIKSPPLIGPHDVYASVKLGIAALKRIQTLHDRYYYGGLTLLDGETPGADVKEGK